MKFLERFFGQKNDEPTPAEPVVSSVTPLENESNRKFEGPYSSPKEKELLEREIKKKGKLLGGQIGSAQFVSLKEDGGGVFKPYSDYEGAKKEMFILRERAAYLINLFLEFDIVPPTVIRDVDNTTGSFQEFITDAETGYELSEQERSAVGDQLFKMYIFDEIINNDDRNAGNWLVKDGKVYAIDHGYSLAMEDAGKKYLSSIVLSRALPEETVAKLRRFVESEENKDILKKLLYELFDKRLVDAYMKRIAAFAGAIMEDGQLSEEVFQSNLVS